MKWILLTDTVDSFGFALMQKKLVLLQQPDANDLDKVALNTTVSITTRDYTTGYQGKQRIR